MRPLAAVVAFTLAVPVGAQQNAPVKLVIITGPNGGGVVVVDYPSLARCEKAALVVENEWKRRFNAAQERAANQPYATSVSPGFTSFAFCIPS